MPSAGPALGAVVPLRGPLTNQCVLVHSKIRNSIVSEYWFVLAISPDRQVTCGVVLVRRIKRHAIAYYSCLKNASRLATVLPRLQKYYAWLCYPEAESIGIGEKTRNKFRRENDPKRQTNVPLVRTTKTVLV